MKQTPSHKPKTEKEKAKYFTREELCRIIIKSEVNHVRAGTLKMLLLKLGYKMVAKEEAPTVWDIEVTKMKRGQQCQH